MDPDQTLEREAEPGDDDMAVQAIEIQFAIPVFLPPGAVRELHDLISAAVKLKANQIKGHVHWVSGYGSKPIWRCQADQALMGLPVDPTLPRGPVEPTFDDSVFHIETCCREAYASELERDGRRAP